jgi:hypothetical protein
MKEILPVQNDQQEAMGYKTAMETRTKAGKESRSTFLYASAKHRTWGLAAAHFSGL